MTIYNNNKKFNYFAAVPLRNSSSAGNTLQDCQADYEYNLVDTTDHAQTDRVCSSCAKSVYSHVVCGV